LRLYAVVYLSVNPLGFDRRSLGSLWTTKAEYTPFDAIAPGVDVWFVGLVRLLKKEKAPATAGALASMVS